MKYIWFGGGKKKKKRGGGLKLKNEILRVEFRVKFDGSKLRKQRTSPEATQLGCFLVYLQADLTPIMGPHGTRD